jgi:hypothetical protein
MKRILVCVGLLALAGCASLQKAADWLADPRTAQAAANLRTLASAVDCGLVAPGAALARDIAEAVEAGQATVDRAGKVHAVSAAICAALENATGR